VAPSLRISGHKDPLCITTTEINMRTLKNGRREMEGMVSLAHRPLAGICGPRLIHIGINKIITHNGGLQFGLFSTGLVRVTGDGRTVVSGGRNV
jgi:hypothetical protein